MEVIPVMMAVSTPVVGYVGYVHNRLSRTDAELAKHKLHVADHRVAKEDYHRDMDEVKELLREMRGDIKAIIGVPQ